MGRLYVRKAYHSIRPRVYTNSVQQGVYISSFFEKSLSLIWFLGDKSAPKDNAKQIFCYFHTLGMHKRFIKKQKPLTALYLKKCNTYSRFAP